VGIKRILLILPLQEQPIKDLLVVVVDLKILYILLLVEGVLVLLVILHQVHLIVQQKMVVLGFLLLLTERLRFVLGEVEREVRIKGLLLVLGATAEEATAL
jgi:hypothetical protein